MQVGAKDLKGPSSSPYYLPPRQGGGAPLNQDSLPTTVARLNQVTASTLLSQLAFGSDAVQGILFAVRQAARSALRSGPLPGSDQFIQIPIQILQQYHRCISPWSTGDRTTRMSRGTSLIEAENRHAVLGVAWDWP
jgi:hypothetical protein